MTEADFLYQISIVVDRLWALIQWWASVSFGLVALSHFASSKINRALLVLVIFLYSSYSFWLYGLLSHNEALLSDYISDLSTLYESGVSMSAAGLRVSAGPNTTLILTQLITMVGTYIGCISYLVFSYMKGKEESDHGTHN